MYRVPRVITRAGTFPNPTRRPLTRPSAAPARTAPAAPRAPTALELTLDPVAAQEFLDGYGDRRPLVLARDEPGRFDAILCDADVERLV